MSQLQPRRSLKPIVNNRLWNKAPITTADAIAGELVQMHEQVLVERDQLMQQKLEMEAECHKFETQNMSDQQKISDLERQIKELTTGSDQLRSQVAELREENASLQKVDAAQAVRLSYLDEDDSYNFIVDAYNRRSVHEGASNQNDDHEYEQAVQMAVALSARESATYKREIHNLALIVEHQDILIQKLEEKLANQQRTIKPKRSNSSNLLLLEDMERDLRRESIQAIHQRKQFQTLHGGHDQDGYSSLQVHTSVAGSTVISTPIAKADHSTVTSRRTSASSALSGRKSRSIPPATPPPREPLPPLPLRESYTSSSARTSSSSVQSFSISSPTTYSSSEWEKSRSSLNNYQADLHNKEEGDTHPEVTRSRSGFWRGLRTFLFIVFLV
ncbi:hypothetical protein K450DRAFT_236279 [Umbelopsis ramanniana AG]|uniref:Uncharacterized protein n=1 Tax=Umbelopsis ramanniana AG TaxID=1314678 RepID=A0AAD5HDR0_UMBRA|nr:uncharacterized protein K450DRAFT_236279 [Umbelopsis ramanniana AG]KAI8580575.1 hypothetical protein K450DRAFT_236279 [Umbelopsis ramanniana AG]